MKYATFSRATNQRGIHKHARNIRDLSPKACDGARSHISVEDSAIWSRLLQRFQYGITGRTPLDDASLPSLLARDTIDTRQVVPERLATDRCEYEYDFSAHVAKEYTEVVGNRQGRLREI